MASKKRSAAYSLQSSVVQPKYSQKSHVSNLPAPAGGWNTRDPLAEMPPTDAIVLDNLIPGNGDVQLRNGYTAWATGLGSYVESLMEYTSPTTSKLFAATPTTIWDVTASGTAIGTSGTPIGLLLSLTGGTGSGIPIAVASLTNGRWQYVNFGAPGGNYLVICNGADAVHNFDGTTWTTPTLSGGPASTTLVNVNSHANRLWFMGNNSTSVWYLPTASISGALTELPLGPYLKLGGYIVAMASWSQDGGAGMSDLACFISSKGEVVVYSGTDPSSSATWTQVGVFKIAPPLGRRCFLKAGSDVAIITEIGVIPMSKALAFNVSAQSLVAFTDKISGAFKQYNAIAGSAFGWQFIEYPSKQLFIVNAPLAERQTQNQFVMNARTGAWCRFTNLNAGCWGRLNDRIYFGDNSGNVWQYSTSDYSDNNTTISGLYQQAFTDCGIPMFKRFVSARPMVLATPGFVPNVSLTTDYDTSTPASASSVSATSLPQWNVARWNTSYWSPSVSPNVKWQSISKIGKVASVAMNFTTQGQISINSMDLMYEPGGYY